MDIPQNTNPDDEQPDESTGSTPDADTKTDPSSDDVRTSRRSLLQTAIAGIALSSFSGLANHSQAAAVVTDKQSRLNSAEASAASPPKEFTTPLWTQQFDGHVGTATDDGELYVSTEPESSTPRLLSFDLQTGNERWNRSISTFGFLRLVGSTLVMEDGSSVTAYERSSGDQRWEVQYPNIGSDETASLTISQVGEETIVIASETEGITQNRLVGVDQTTGKIKWEKGVSLPGEHRETTFPYSSSSSEGYVMFGTTGGHRILKITAATGTITEQHTIPLAEPLSDSTDGGNPLFLGGPNSDFFIINNSVFESGTQTTVVRVFTSLESDPEVVITGSTIRRIDSVTGSEAYVVETDGTLRTVEVPSGRTLWEESTDPGVAERRINAGFDPSSFYELRFTSAPGGGFDGTIIARDVTSGNQQWSRTVLENVETDAGRPPFVQLRPFVQSQSSQEQLFVGRDNGVYITLDGSTGDVKEWAVSLSSEADSYGLRPWADDVVLGQAREFGSPDQSDATTLSVFPEPDDGARAESLSVSLSPSSVTFGGQTTVTVTASSGSAVPGATVEITDLTLSATTDTNGEATLSLSSPNAGDYVVSASADGYTDATATLTIEDDSVPTDPTERVLQITGKSDPSQLTQNDVTATITRFNRGQSVNGVTVTQNDVTAMITLFGRN